MIKTIKTGILATVMGLTSSAAFAEELHLYNWTDYTSPDLIAKFEAETGIKVVVDTYDSNETLLAKLQTGVTGYDVVFPSQHFVEIMVKEDLLQKIDIKGMPNYANVVAKFQNPPWDPTQEYSAPWHWGSASVQYRSDLYDGTLETLGEFFEPSEQVNGRLQVFKSADEVVTLASLYLDIPFCTEDPQDAKRILELLKGQKDAVLLYASESMTDRLANGEVIMASAWNGDTMKGRLDVNENIVYAFPKEGVVGWFDSIVVPKGASNVEAAKVFINFMMAPENIAINANFARYATAITGASDYFDADMVGAPELATPTVPVVFGEACSADGQKLIERIWTQLLK